MYNIANLDNKPSDTRQNSVNYLFINKYLTLFSTRHVFYLTNRRSTTLWVRGRFSLDVIITRKIHKFFSSAVFKGNFKHLYLTVLKIQSVEMLN